MNEIARHFLETYAQGGEVDGGWLFAKALQQAQLDYSDKSLGRLDQLLAAIRERAKPSRETLQDTLPGRNFCSLLAYYVIEVLRRRTGATIDWHDRASALRVFPAGTQLPDAPFTRLIAVADDQAAAYWPLGWVEPQVLGDGQQQSVGDYVANLAAQIERDGPVVWWTGMHALGQMASMQMMTAADGGTVLPMRLSSTAPTTWVTSAGVMFGEDLDDALHMGGRMLEENKEGATWQVFSYDGILDIGHDRFDAVMVLLYTYGKSPLRLKIAFPYRPADGARAFSILDPRLREANVDKDKIAMLNGAMERGIQSIKWAFGTTWDQLREVEESAQTAVSACSKVYQVASLQPRPEMEQVIIELRKTFLPTQKMLNERNFASIRAPQPRWMRESDPLAQISKQQMLLHTEGRIVWAALVQANNLLFSPGADDCPAMLLYSTDAHFDSRPHELRAIASNIFGIKDTEQTDPELKRVAAFVSNEMDRSMDWKLPEELTAKQVSAATFMVFRQHIPNGVLTASLFPILIHPSTPAVMIVPFEFWPLELITMWKQRKLSLG